MTLRFTIAILLLSTVAAFPARAATPPDSTDAWKADLIGRLAISQIGFQNWKEGGLNTLSSLVGLDAKISRTDGDWAQTHEINLAFGLVKQDTLNVRKADDVIRLRSSVQYQGEGLFKDLNPTLAVEARTQFAAGFSYKKNPFEDGRKPPVKVSDFFAPAVFKQALGLTYEPDGWFLQRMGIGAKETVVALGHLRPVYKLDPDQAVRMELGVESRTQVDKEVFENVRYKSSLGLFAAFNQPDLPDLLWENQVQMKVNAWLSVNFEYTALYDRDLSSQLQMKEMLSVGLTYAFL